MTFKEGQEVQLITWGTADGKEAIVKGMITKLTHGHAIVCIRSISEGVRLAVKPSGDIVLLGPTSILKSGWKRLDIGDSEAVPLSNLRLDVEYKPAPEWISVEAAKRWLGKYAGGLDESIKRGSIKPTVDGLVRAADIAWMKAAYPTYEANLEKEQRQFGDDAKEFNRLGSKLHPQFFGKAW